MKWRFVLLSLVLALLAACGASTTQAPPVQQATTPDAVHRGWIGALQAGNRDEQLRLLAERNQKELYVDTELNRVHGRFSTSKTTGDFQGIEFREPARRDREPGLIGISIWRYALQTRCYETWLTETDQGWQVADWGASGRGCPEGIV